MPFADIFLDTSWSLYTIVGSSRTFRTFDEIAAISDEQVTAQGELKELSDSLETHLSRRSAAEPKDELNDQASKHGRLSRCVVRPVSFKRDMNGTHEDEAHKGLQIEARYQLTQHRIVILRHRDYQNGTQNFALMFHKGNQKFINNVRDWMDSVFDLPYPEPYALTPYTLLQMFAGFVETISTGWDTSAGQIDALRLAILGQVVGNVKITITFGTKEIPDLAAKLKHIELDIPSDTINELIGDTSGSTTNGKGAGKAALDGLRKGTHEKTGLKLPFTTEQDGSNNIEESPCKISKIVCAALAVSTEGKLKFSSKPIEQAELRGYEETLVRNAMSQVLDLLFQEVLERVESSA